MAIECGSKDWKLGLGDGRQEREVTVAAGHISRLMEEISKSKRKFGLPADAPVYSCYEAGRDGFWIHRMLIKKGVNNIVVDSSSIEVSRKARRAKTDKLDARRLRGMLIRHILYGEKKIWIVLHVPTEAEEESRRPTREAQRLTHERSGHLCRIRSLLALHGIKVRSVRCDLSRVRDWDGQPLSESLSAEIKREHERIKQLDEQIKVIKEYRAAKIENPKTEAERKAVKLAKLKGLGKETGWNLSHEFFGWRKFNNRREVGSAAGLTGSPYNSGNSFREQGISKAGSKRVRTMTVEAAWRWLRFQPDTELSKWYQRRFANGGKRLRRIGIVALSRKLLVVLWKYLEFDMVPEGARIAA
jgi:transposase